MNADEEELTLIPGVDLDFAQQIQQLSFEVRKKKESGTFDLPEGFHDAQEEDGLKAAMRELKAFESSMQEENAEQPAEAAGPAE